MVDVIARTPNITIAATPPPGPELGDLWWSPITGQQSVYHNDGNTTQWVISNWGAGKQGPPGLPGSVFVDDFPPMTPVSGTLWWSNELGVLFVWYDDGTSAQWVATGGGGGGGSTVHAGDLPPTAPMVNSLWWNTTLGELFIYYNDGTSTQWVPASPAVPPENIATGVFSVLEYGAVGDGVADDTGAIRTAIAAAGGQRGGEVRFGSGTYLITQTLDIPWPNVFLKGLGPDGLHSTPPHNTGAATILKWGGAHGGTMIHIRSPAGAAVKKLYGGGVAGIGFHSGYVTLNTGADYGIRISSRDQGLYDNNFFYALRRKAILLDCITDVLADARDTQNNVFTRQFSRNTYDNPEGGLFHLKGDESILYNTANVSLNYFENCGAQFNAGIVYELGASDHNTFELCRANRIQHSYTVAGATVTISNGTPCIVTHTAHGMVNSGLQKSFTTTGALPAPLVVGTRYYVSVIDANTYRLCATLSDFAAGVFVNTTTDGSGTHTANPAGGDAIRFRGSNVASSLAAVDNTFRDYTGGDSIYAEGTTSCVYPSVDNILENVDQTNYTPLPTKEAGARCWLRDRTDGTTNDLMASGVVVGGAGLKSTVLSAFLHQIFSRVTNESLRVSNRATDHIRLEAPSADYTSSTAEWGISVSPTSGDLRLNRLIGSGLMTLTTGLKSSHVTNGIGYGTGAGGTVTQLTSKATLISLNRVSGLITTFNDALAAGAVVTFRWNNTSVVAEDVIILNHDTTIGGTIGAYALTVRCDAGFAMVTIRNLTAGSLSEAIGIRFAVIKGVIA